MFLRISILFGSAMVSPCREMCRGVRRKRALPAAVWKLAGKSKLELDNNRLVGWLRLVYFLVKELFIANLCTSPRLYSSH
jgi:hypothetical protein